MIMGLETSCEEISHLRFDNIIILSEVNGLPKVLRGLVLMSYLHMLWQYTEIFVHTEK